VLVPEAVEVPAGVAEFVVVEGERDVEGLAGGVLVSFVCRLGVEDCAFAWGEFGPDLP
jgi:hypothetical protein